MYCIICLHRFVFVIVPSSFLACNNFVFFLGLECESGERVKTDSMHFLSQSNWFTGLIISFLGTERVPISISRMQNCSHVVTHHWNCIRIRTENTHASTSFWKKFQSIWGVCFNPRLAAALLRLLLVEFLVQNSRSRFLFSFVSGNLVLAQNFYQRNRIQWNDIF